jgi:soluble lytic murein transglycosylase-like protein
MECVKRSLILLVLWFAGSCLALPLSSDSTNFAKYWSFIDAGDTDSAQHYLLNLDSAERDCTGQMVNFFLAWQSYSKGDYPGVPVYLDLGVPHDLQDYALWMRADALRHSGTTGLATAAWKELSKDSNSVWATEGLYQLALAYYQNGEITPYFQLDSLLAGRPLARESRQHLAELSADGLASLNQYEAAIGRLWAGYAIGPSSSEGRRLHDEIQSYPQRYSSKPRTQNLDELAQELTAYEQKKEFSTGLERVVRANSGAVPDSVADLLWYFKGRYQSGLSQHRDAISSLLFHSLTYPKSPYRNSGLYYLGRSAYLKDQDTLAIASLDSVAFQTADNTWAGKALDLLGTLYLDRKRNTDAVDVYQRWAKLCQGTAGEPDCLWRLGRAQWEAGRWNDADSTWCRLISISDDLEYAPTALYWSGRAAEKAGNTAKAQQQYTQLKTRFPFSFYSITLKAAIPDSIQLQDRPLTVASLDELWESGGSHSRKFAMLATMRLTDFALKEWPLAAAEQNGSDGFSWWKAQCYLWKNDRMWAWRVILTDLGSYLRSQGDRPAEFFRTAYPLDFDPQIVQLARKYNLDPYFIFALICQESHYDANAASPVGAMGLMQLMPATARQQARQLKVKYSAGKLRDPEFNLSIGIAHAASLFGEFNGDTVLILAAYNAGPSAAQAWFEEFGTPDRNLFIERIPYRETRLFIKRNIEHRAAYRRLYPDAGNLVH